MFAYFKIHLISLLFCCFSVESAQATGKTILVSTHIALHHIKWQFDSSRVLKKENAEDEDDKRIFFIHDSRQKSSQVLMMISSAINLILFPFSRFQTDFLRATSSCCVRFTLSSSCLDLHIHASLLLASDYCWVCKYLWGIISISIHA